MMNKIFFRFIVVNVIILSPIITQASDDLSPGPLVRLFNASQEQIREFYAYDENSAIGANAVIDDFTGDGKPEIITAPQLGAAPHIKIFDIKGKMLSPGWFAFSENFRGGVNLASGDVTGDGIADLIVSQASEGQAWVKVYTLTQADPVVVTEFLAYPESFEGGTYIAAGDLTGNGKDEIITGAGYGGGPQVRVFNKKGQWTGQAFFPFPEDFHGGVTVASGDVNNDGKDEIITGQARDAQSWIKVYDSNGTDIISTFKAYPAEVEYGVTLAVSNIDNNKKEEIIVGPGIDGGPQIRTFTATGNNLSNFFAYSDSFRGRTQASYFSGNSLYVTTVAELKTAQKVIGPKVALTFDDGYSSPSGSLTSILNTLRAHDLQVTFFLLGDWIEDHPSEMQQIIADGHEVANHSYNHPLFTTLSEAQIRNEVIATENLIKQFGVDPKPNFRYPYGGHNSYTDSIISGLGYKYWHWTASTADTGSGISTQNAVNGALANLHDGGIILSHVSSDYTAAGLDTIITTIENSGYTIVKVSEL